MHFINHAFLSAIFVNFAGCVYGNEFPTIFNISYTASDERPAELLAYLLEIDFYASINPNLPVEPVLKAFNLEKCELNHVYEIFQRNNLHFSEWDILEVLKALNISVVKTYTEFTSKVENPDRAVKKALDSLKIDTEKLNAFLLYNREGNESIFVEILRKGVYNVKSVADALIAINRTDEDLFKFMKPIILSRIVSIDDFMHLVKPGADISPILETACSILPINMSVIMEEPLVNILKAYNSTLENATSLGTAISFNNIAAVAEHPRWVTERYLKINVKNINGSNFMVSNLTYGQILNVTANHGARFFKVAKDYDSSFKTCSILNDDVSINVEEVINNKTSIWVKNNSTVKIGAPLVCNQTIYGLAIKSNGSLIDFATFYKSASNKDHAQFQILGAMYLVILLFYAN